MSAELERGLALLPEYMRAGARSSPVSSTRTLTLKWRSATRWSVLFLSSMHYLLEPLLSSVTTPVRALRLTAKACQLQHNTAKLDINICRSY